MQLTLAANKPQAVNLNSQNLLPQAPGLVDHLEKDLYIRLLKTVAY